MWDSNSAQLDLLHNDAGCMACAVQPLHVLLMPVSLTRAVHGHGPLLLEKNTVEVANSKTWDPRLGMERGSILRPQQQTPHEWDEEEISSLMEETRQPGLLEDDRLDIFIDELVDRVRLLRDRDVRVARDLVWVVGTHVRRGLLSRLPSLRRASARIQPVQEAWLAAMRDLQNVHSNENREWAWNWWARLRAACRSASRRYKRRRLMNQVVEVEREDSPDGRDLDRLPQEDEQGIRCGVIWHGERGAECGPTTGRPAGDVRG